MKQAVDPTIGRRSAVAATLLLLLAGRTQPAHAYVASVTNESQTELRWMKTNCVHIRTNKAGSDDLKDGSDLAAVKKATENWHKAAGDCTFIRFELHEASGDAAIAFDEFGTNINDVVWIEKGWEHDRQAAGITTVFFIDKKDSAQDGRILDADVEINGQYFHYTTSGDKSRTDVENTLTHELGHVLGLDHPCDDGTRTPVPKDHEGKAIPKCFPPLNLPAAMRDVTMYNFADPGETKKRSPEKDDVLGICETYPKDKDPKQCVAVDLTREGCAVVATTSDGQGADLGFLLLALAALLALAPTQRRR